MDTHGWENYLNQNGGVRWAYIQEPFFSPSWSFCVYSLFPELWPPRPENNTSIILYKRFFLYWWACVGGWRGNLPFPILLHDILLLFCNVNTLPRNLLLLLYLHLHTTSERFQHLSTLFPCLVFYIFLHHGSILLFCVLRHDLLSCQVARNTVIARQMLSAFQACLAEKPCKIVEKRAKHVFGWWRRWNHVKTIILYYIILLYYIIFYFILLYYIITCFIMLYFILLYHIITCFIILYYVLLCNIIPCYIICIFIVIFIRIYTLYKDIVSISLFTGTPQSPRIGGFGGNIYTPWCDGTRHHKNRNLFGGVFCKASGQNACRTHETDRNVLNILTYVHIYMI